jgi:hypothetical protein
MGRDSILDDANQNRQQNTGSEPADESDSETDEESDRVRVTQRLPPALAADVDIVQERYNLPSRNATINFILTQGIDQLLDGERR